MVTERTFVVFVETELTDEQDEAIAAAIRDAVRPLIPGSEGPEGDAGVRNFRASQSMIEEVLGRRSPVTSELRDRFGSHLAGVRFLPPDPKRKR